MLSFCFFHRDSWVLLLSASQNVLMKELRFDSQANRASCQFIASQLQSHCSLLACDSGTFLPARGHEVNLAKKRVVGGHWKRKGPLHPIPRRFFLPLPAALGWCVGHPVELTPPWVHWNYFAVGPRSQFDSRNSLLMCLNQKNMFHSPYQWLVSG